MFKTKTITTDDEGRLVVDTVREGGAGRRTETRGFPRVQAFPDFLLVGCIRLTWEAVAVLRALGDDGSRDKVFQEGDYSTDDPLYEGGRDRSSALS